MEGCTTQHPGGLCSPGRSWCDPCWERHQRATWCCGQKNARLPQQCTRAVLRIELPARVCVYGCLYVCVCVVGCTDVHTRAECLGIRKSTNAAFLVYPTPNATHTHLGFAIVFALGHLCQQHICNGLVVVTQKACHFFEVVCPLAQGHTSPTLLSLLGCIKCMVNFLGGAGCGG